MPTKYQINITNNNSDNTNYLVLCAVPEASDEMGKGWTNVWAKTPGVGKKGGNTQINFTDETFAVCGMAPQELGPRVNISTSQSVSVNLGPSDAGAVSAAIIDSGLLFDSDPAPTKVQAGFEIHTKVWTNAQYCKLIRLEACMVIRLIASLSYRFLWYGQDSTLFEPFQSHPSGHLDC